jgi:AmiR/NasT family two-component response regulator
MNNSAKNTISVLSDYSLFLNTLYKIIPVIPISNVCYKFFNSVFDIERIIKEEKPSLIILNKVNYTPEEINYLINNDYKNISLIIMIDSYFKYDLFYVNFIKGIITVRRPLSINKLLEIVKSSLFSFKKKNKIEDYIKLRTIEMAKTFLITYENMFEDETHKSMEKDAMEKRKNMYDIASNIVIKYLKEKEDINYESKNQ